MEKEVPPPHLTPEQLAEQLQRLYKNEILIEAKGLKIRERLEKLLTPQK